MSSKIMKVYASVYTLLHLEAGHRVSFAHTPSARTIRASGVYSEDGRIQPHLCIRNLRLFDTEANRLLCAAFEVVPADGFRITECVGPFGKLGQSLRIRMTHMDRAYYATISAHVPSDFRVRMTNIGTPLYDPVARLFALRLNSGDWQPEYMGEGIDAPFSVEARVVDATLAVDTRFRFVPPKVVMTAVKA